MSDLEDERKKRNQQRLALLLAAAKKTHRDDADRADSLYSQAVMTAEILYGKFSLQTAQALLEQQEFYELQGNRTETMRIRERIRQVLKRLIER